MSFGSTANDQKEQVRQATNIVDLVGGYLDLRRQGRVFVGQCPWHDDSRPSLQVDASRQSWKCWPCAIGGDVFSFVMRYEHVEFREALEMLADRAGIKLVSISRPKTQPGDPNDKQTLFQAVAWAEQQFQEFLKNEPDAEPARRYLAERGISGESLRHFRLGYAPDRWSWLLDRARSTMFSPQVLEAVGLASHGDSGRYTDFFRGRVMFPVRDVQERPIAFGARILPEVAARLEREGKTQGKYINTRETPLFSKSENLYALNLARGPQTRENIVVVEGYTDVILAHQAGVTNVVAVLGTALNERHIRVLRRFTDSITLVLDGDDAGQKRTNEILGLFVAAQVDLRTLTLPDGLDPCDFVLQHGGDAFRQELARSIDALEHKFRVATHGIDLNNETHRASQALEEILRTMATAPRLIATTSETHRLREQQMLARLARQFRLPEADVRIRLGELRKKGKKSNLRPRDEDATKPLLETLRPPEKELFEIMLFQPNLVPLVLEKISDEELTSPAARRLHALYVSLEARGESLEFARLVTETEEPDLKHLLVELDEQSHAKALAAGDQREADPLTRLNGLIRDFDVRETREQLAALDEKKLSDEEELPALLEFYARLRERQGISVPTDGQVP